MTGLSANIFATASPELYELVADSLWNQSSSIEAGHELRTNISFLKESLIMSDMIRARHYVDRIESILTNGETEPGELADAMYYMGLYYKFSKDYDLAIRYLSRAIERKELNGISDIVYSRALYNLGASYSGTGMFDKHRIYTRKALEQEKKIYGENSHELISTYGSLITAYIELKEYSRALEYTDIAYKIAQVTETCANPEHIAFLYNNMGVLYNSTGDYSKSRIFFDKAEEFYSRSDDVKAESLINLYYGKSVTLTNLNRNEDAEKYFNMGILLANTDYSTVSYSLLSSRAAKLGKEGKVKQGAEVFIRLINRVEKEKGKNSRDYHEVLVLYAGFLDEFNIDKAKALEYYQTSLDFFKKQEKAFLKFEAAKGLAILLAENGEYFQSLNTLQSLLFPADSIKECMEVYSNPDVRTINPDNDYLSLFKTKYQILKELYFKTEDIKILATAAETAELVISILERRRISISEEESRLLLGDKYRDSYINVISDFYQLASLTNEQHYFKKTFEYSEKSKIAGLLASTRELKATEFHIPAELAEKERDLQSEIALLNDWISGKSSSVEPNDQLLKSWKSNLFSSIIKRDSLIKVFERDYPEYYAIKYNTKVLGPEAIPSIFGRKCNYISYVISDTVLYMGVVNSKHYKVIATKIDSTFFR